MSLAQEAHRCLCRVLRTTSNQMNNLFNHPYTRIGFALGFLLFLYYQFLVSIGKISGVFDPDAAGEISAQMMSILLPDLMLAIAGSRTGRDLLSDAIQHHHPIVASAFEGERAFSR
jgi:hypothetical protein